MGSPVRKLGFPFLTVEDRHLCLPVDFLVETPGIHAHSLGMRARHVKRLDPAIPAKVVLGTAGVERVSGERRLAGEKPELHRRHDQRQITGLFADRAVAVGNPESARHIHLKPHLPAVTTP